MNPALVQYIENEIIPRYDFFDAAHQRPHVLTVINDSLVTAHKLDADEAMAYVVAAYHDLGLSRDRATHHLVSGQILRNDTKLQRWFTPLQIETMAQAVEDHRASATHEPRSVYGKIVAEADRSIEPLVVITRTVQYGLSHYPDLPREQHVTRAVSHLHEKYGPQGYIKLWIPGSENERQLQKLRELMADEARLLHTVSEIYDSLVSENHRPDGLSQP